jgi:hypothetical protein
MYKKTMTYTDYNGQSIKEDFYFNLTRAEIMEMQLEKVGGLAEKIQEVIDSKNVPELIKIFKDLILRSYGIKSEDGKHFIKSDELSKSFTQTEAYSDLFMLLATNADEAAAFVNGIIPENLRNQVEKSQQQKELENKK